MSEPTHEPQPTSPAGPAARTRPRYYHDLLQAQKIARDGDAMWAWGTVSGRMRADRRARMYVEHGALRRETRALEVGCGTGIFTEQVCNLAGTRVVAFDVALDLVQIARKKPGAHQALFVVADAEALPFAADTFDAVYGSSVLHHLDVKASLVELRRVLRPGAAGVFTEPNMMNPQIILQKKIPAIGRAVGDIPGETAFFRWPLHRMLKRVGFTDVIVRPFDFLHPLVPRRFAGAVDRLTRFVERVPLVREIAGSLLIVFRKSE